MGNRTISRRGLLGGAATGAAGYALAGPAAGAAKRAQRVDVAVVGAGIAGICTAWELAAAGRTVAVLEADRIAASVTGYTTAKLSAQHTLIYARIRSSFGADSARWYAQSQQQAVERVATVAKAASSK